MNGPIYFDEAFKMYPALPVRSIEGFKQGVKKKMDTCVFSYLVYLNRQINDRLLDHTYIHTKMIDR